MATPEIPVPDKIIVILRDPDRSLLASRSSRALIDLLFVAGPIPSAGMRSAEIQVHSLVYLAQEFGLIDTDYVFYLARDSGDLVSLNLSWNLNMTTFKEWKFQVPNNEDLSFRLTPKAIELLGAVGGVQTIEPGNEELIRKLAELAREKTLISFASFMFIKMDVAKSLKDGSLSQTGADDILLRFERLRVGFEKLEQEFRPSE